MKRMFLLLTLSLFLLAGWAVGTATAANDPPPPIQAVGQSGSNDQTAVAGSAAVQQQPQNQNVSVRVLSPGDDGSVSQTNSATSNAAAANSNTATQGATQAAQSAPCGCSSPIQVAGQLTGSGQGVDALSAAQQLAPSNGNAPTDAVSPSSGGSSSQSNSAGSAANAGNTNGSGQTANQSAVGGGSGTQVAAQGTDNKQGAVAGSAAAQTQPQNSNISVRVLSPGNAGPVSQTNSASSNASASNVNSATQGAGQTSAGGSGSGTQVAKQDASNSQNALGASAAVQEKPTNSNTSVRVLSPGNDGSVSQTNAVSSNGSASNTNSSNQSATQSDPASTSCGCGSGSPNQVAIQSSKNDQAAGALSAALQEGASNSNDPVRVLSPGTDGPVTQQNTDSSSSSATNSNSSGQTATQNASAGICCGSGAIQVIGQSAESKQADAALSAAVQKNASNTDDPLRVLSPGSDGSVIQTNSASSNAVSSNINADTQTGTQTASSGLCCGGAPIQVIGQKVDNSQEGLVKSAVEQTFGQRLPCGCASAQGNVYNPRRILSPGDDGPVTQTNTASSNGRITNINGAEQSASQIAGPSRCVCGRASTIQAIGQQGVNRQAAAALSAALQLAASNSSDPTRVWSWGGLGSLNQSNGDSSSGSSTNGNRLGQAARQMV
jgi:hypothetical protein